MRAAIRFLAGIGVSLTTLLAMAGAGNAVLCSGTTTALGNGGTTSAAFLLGAGNCVTVSDKIFGEFSASGAISGEGAASFNFVQSPGSVTIGFLGTVLPSSVGTINYSVAVDPALSQGYQISALEKDLTLNAVTGGLAASASLTGGVTSPFVVAFNCDRSVNPSAGTCPETHTFAPVDEIDVSQTITTDGNAIVTALTDTIVQTVPEPSTLAMMGTALIGLWLAVAVRRRDDRKEAGLPA